MKIIKLLFLGVWILLTLTSCAGKASESSTGPMPSETDSQIQTTAPSTNTPPEILPSQPTTEEPSSSSSSNSNLSLEEASREARYEVQEPTYLPDGYTLERITVIKESQSVCLQYHHSTATDSILFIAMGPGELASALEQVDGWPEYALMQESVEIGGAENGLHLSGWQRPGWGCSQAANASTTPYSFALAPTFTWEAGGMIYELYSASRGCATPGGVTILGQLRVAEGLTGESTHPEDELDPECLLSIQDAETLSGIDVKEPAYLPADAAFYYAAYDPVAFPGVTLYYLHQQHPDMGSFFHISQYVEAPPFFMTSCGDLPGTSCEMVNAGSIQVVYQYLNPAEQLDWSDGGYFFSLFRNAGEPGKIYKDDLLKVAESMN